MKAVKLALLLGALALFALAGCGGSEKAKPIKTKADFVAAVKDRCAAYKKERMGLEEQVAKGLPSPSRGTPAKLIGVAGKLKQLDDLTRRTIAGLGSLTRPPAEADGIALAIRATNLALKNLDDVDLAAHVGSVPGVYAALTAFDNELATNPAITEYGIQACR